VKYVRYLLVAAVAAFGYLGYVYATLPDVRALRAANPSTTAFMELRAAEARARGRAPRRLQRWVPYARISPTLKRAVLVAEDAAFWQHEGIDVKQIRESLERDLEKGTFSRGGSTITQQLAKNLFLSPSKNPLRKLRELLIARRLEASLSKRRIFEIYLNVIEWGDGVYGAESASRAYFGKSASQLTAEEAATLAACIINPRLMNPDRFTIRLQRRQRLILSRMGAVTPPPDNATTNPVAPGG
jgi:monofunctional biosynthetic peptidoglycan transglycosylase